MIAAVLAISFAVALSPTTGGDAANRNQADEQALKSANIATDGPALLAYLRRQIDFAAHPDRINVLIRELGDDEFAVRERASENLAALGRAALPLLKKAETEQKDKDPEIAHRARHCIQRIERGSTSSLAGAVVRLLAVRRPPGTAETLLAYAPAAENDTAIDDVRNALAGLAAKDAAVAGMLKEALPDAQPLRRALAAEALCRAHIAGARDSARALLKDADSTVRLRVAMTLAQLHDKEAIPVLIELLPALSMKQLLPVEDLLSMAALENAPAVSPGSSSEDRKKHRDAWSAWWKARGDQLDLAKIAEANKPLGYTLLVLLDEGPGGLTGGVIKELDADNQQRWAVGHLPGGLRLPLDVQLLPNDRILVAEQGGNVVTERNLKGEVVWSKDFDSPLVAQRLPNGNTFIAGKTKMTEIDPDGKELYAHLMPGGSQIMRARRLPNGQIACVNESRRFLHLNDKGRILSGFQVHVATFGGRIDILRNGNILIPEKERDKVVEYSPTGAVVWEVEVNQPIAAVRLPNGNTLVTSMDERRAVEFNRQGKEVWEYRHPTSRVTRAFRR